MLPLRRTRAQCLGRTVAFAALVGLVAFAAPPPAQAAFPGANGKIAFASGLPGCGSGCNPEIYAINADGTGLTNLTKDPAIDYAPAWSPDGRRLAFTRGTPDGVHAIYVMSADGTGVTRVVDGVRPAWSPDGQKIVFEGAGLETVDGNGNKTQIVSSLNGPREAAWSPDGGKIAYSAGGGGGTLGPKDIHTVNPDGTGETRITEGATTTRFDEFPNWSPDGGKIAFSSNKADDEPTTDYDIYIVNPDGTEEARVAAGS